MMMRTPPTLIVVDDNEAVRETLVLSLSIRGHQVVSFESAEAFLDQYKPVERGCLILDVRLSGMSGLELQDVLANRHIYLPIIFMSGHGDMPMSDRAIKQGAVDFLEKPFTTDTLLRRVEVALSEQEGIREQLNERH